jgi:proteic killer suppression protein
LIVSATSFRSAYAHMINETFYTKTGPTMRQKLTDLLLAINEAERPQDVRLFSGWRLHQLKGDLQGFWSVTVSFNWRIIFRFEKGDAFDVH